MHLDQLTQHARARQHLSSKYWILLKLLCVDKQSESNRRSYLICSACVINIKISCEPTGATRKGAQHPLPEVRCWVKRQRRFWRMLSNCCLYSNSPAPDSVM